MADAYYTDDQELKSDELDLSFLDEENKEEEK